MTAEIVAIGTELLLGAIVNSDTAFLGKALAGLGISCYRQVTVGDNPGRLEEALRTALDRADLVITCGGLGPTVDDVTLEAISTTTGRPLRLNKPLLKRIEGRFKRLGIKMPPSNRRQAYIPAGGRILPNPFGTASGIVLTLRNERLLVALPGPPQELIPMVNRYLIPRLRRYTGQTVIRTRTLKITGQTESEIDAKVRDILALDGVLTVGIYAHPGQVDLKITARAKSGSAAQKLIAGVEGKIRKRLGELIYGTDEETLEQVVGKLLMKRRWTLGVAESCTGGLIQHRITEVAGSSKYFKGGVIAYANALKQGPLHVPSEILRKHGAVSAQTTKAMAEGVRKLTGADLGLSVTGIAGPMGESKSKPVGLVYLALAQKGKTDVQKRFFSGNRSTIKFKTSQAALNLIRKLCL